mgnify:CR=1 FL=1
MDEKIGVLRKYLKETVPHKELSIRKKNRRHPTSLNIIDSYNMRTHTLEDHFEFEEKEEQEREHNSLQVC